MQRSARARRLQKVSFPGKRAIVRPIRRPGVSLAWWSRHGAQVADSTIPRSVPMPPLITVEEALELAEISSRDEITALVERAWEVRTERFGDSTDMCSLVNAKSGGCAEDCGFCAQSRRSEEHTSELQSHV